MATMSVNRLNFARKLSLSSDIQNQMIFRLQRLIDTDDLYDWKITLLTDPYSKLDSDPDETRFQYRIDRGTPTTWFAVSFNAY